MAFVPAPDAVLADKYRLIRRLAGGGMGSVWLARHLTLDSEVAVKLMAPAIAETPLARSRFEREAKACAQLRSPHVVKVFDYGLNDGTPFMVMELLDGEDLAARLEQRGTLTLVEAAVMTTQLAKALRAAHEAGIVHRDIKPGNIFFTKEGDDEVVKLVDFGVVRETRTVLVDDPTSSGVVIGSPHHMSPEQARGEKVGPKSDLWSLGVVLFRALTGERPFSGDGLAAVLLKVVSGPIPSAVALRPGLPTAVDRFFSRALAREVEQRFENVTVLARALELIAAGGDADRLLDTPASSSPFDTTVPVAAQSSNSGSTGHPRAPPAARNEVSTPNAAGRISTADSAEVAHGRATTTAQPRWRALALASSLVAIALAGYALSRPSPSLHSGSGGPSDGGDRVSPPSTDSFGSPLPPAEVIVSPTRAELSAAPVSSPSGHTALSVTAPVGLRPPAVPQSSAKRCAQVDAFTGLCVSP